MTLAKVGLLVGCDNEDPVSQVRHAGSVKPDYLDPGSVLDMCFLGTMCVPES